MEEIVDRKICSGCHACVSVCPQNCIYMQPDENGFLYPVIDEEQCIKCNRCKNICSVKHPGKTNKGSAYACINKDENTRMQSSSGGIFSILAEYVLDEGGVVFGAAFDDDFNVKHICVENYDDLCVLRGSKYLQSTIGNTYVEAKKLLEDGRMVLFSGTPCQIRGLNAFLNNKEYENLVTLDIICHGVPSPKVWDAYLKFRKEKQNSNINYAKFRDKSTGWDSYSLVLDFDNQQRYQCVFKNDPYMRAFVGNLSLRNSCYNCHSKSLERESDFTLADFWGIKNVCEDMYDNKGTSLILINSQKGERIFGGLKSNINYCPTDIDEIPKYNISVCKSVERHPNRKMFFDMINSGYDFEKTVNKCLQISFVKRVLRYGKRRVIKLRDLMFKKVKK